MERSDACGGVVVGAEPPGMRAVEHRVEQSESPIGGVVTAVPPDPRVQLRGFVARQVGEPAVPPGRRDQRRFLSRATEDIVGVLEVDVEVRVDDVLAVDVDREVQVAWPGVTRPCA
jgi:hypothetical protein